jgi:hypothetical protein
MNTMNISVRNGVATLPDGTTVNLLEVQSALNCAFGETGRGEYALAANMMALITGMVQGPHEEWLPAED